MLQGKLSAPATLGGALQGGVGLQGTLAGVGSIHPVYDGATEFTPTESAQTIGTEGKVVPTDLTIDAIPSGYVGSAVDRRDASDLTASGATVTAPAGYYAEPASKAVASGNITMRRPTMDEAVGEIRSRADITTGYVTGGSYGGSALILDKQAGTTITPTESEQVAVAQYRWTTGDVKVAAIPSQYIVPTGTYTVTGGGTHDVTQYASASVAAATPTNSSDSEYITSSGVRKWRYRPKTIVPTAGWAAQRSASNPINGFWQTFDAIPTGTAVTPTTSAQTIGGADTMMEGAVTVAAIPSQYIVPSGTKPIAANGTGIDVTEYAAVDVAVPIPTPSLQSKSKSYTPTETAQSETVSADAVYDGLSSVAVSVGAISSTYVGSGITRRDSTDLTASGATVTVPSGYYESQASKAVASGTAGTPSATKGAVSNHSVSVTPSVTNTAGYIAGGTLTGTAVSVSASELVSGTLSITSSGTKDVTNYASASVAAGGTTASATKGSVSNHSVTVTPSVTRTAGFVTAGTSSGTAVTVSASELVSGSETKTANGTYDVTNLAELVVNVSGGGSSVKTATGTFTGNGTRTIDVACTFEPDIVYFTSNPGTTASSGTVAAIIVRDMMTATRYRNASTTNSHYAIPGIADLNSNGSSYSWRATYANSKVTLYCYSNNARGLLTNGRTYSYTFIKWT